MASIGATRDGDGTPGPGSSPPHLVTCSAGPRVQRGRRAGRVQRGKMAVTHILVIDDDPRLTSALRRTLSYEGYQVSSATNGESALAQIRLKPPDLVIL